ncbi:hypothetical protein TWF718_007272 [Orbilia javanica]|uniref:Uncharacterized protein n=1 Tax=Orbilia javanica TaxID=47235 RepID=A0AAN8RIQ1_9PEZI
MLEILDFPPEILELIIDELALSPALTSEFLDSVHQRLSRRILPLGQTCRFFYQFILPRFYSNCFLEFRELFGEGPEYRLYDSSAAGTVRKYNGFLKNGTLVKNLNVRFDERAGWLPPARDWTSEKWSEFQQVSQSAPQTLEKLVPRFDHLRRVEFQRDIGSQGSLGDLVRGLSLVLSQVPSLRALDLSVQYSLEDKSDWDEAGIEFEHPVFVAKLHDLSISIEPFLHEVSWDQEPTDGDLLDSLWFMDILVDYLKVPSRTVRNLNFEFIFEGFERCPIGYGWLNGRDYGAATNFARERLELPHVGKLYLTLGNGGQFAYEQYFKIDHREVRDLSLQMVTLSRGKWSKEIPFIKSFSKLEALTLYHPRNIKPVEAVAASLSHFNCLKEITVRLFAPSSQVTAIMDKFEKDPKVKVEKFGSNAGFVTVCLHL